MAYLAYMTNMDFPGLLLAHLDVELLLPHTMHLQEC